jgi:hypothetical protein
MRFLAVEDEASREGPPELSQALDSAATTFIAADFERSCAGDSNFDIVAFLQFKRLDHGGRQANC